MDQKLQKHRKAKNASLFFKHFQTPNNNFQRNAKFIEKITKAATAGQSRLVFKNEKTFGLSSYKYFTQNHNCHFSLRILYKYIRY